MLGPLFDTVGRKPMIAGTYILSGVLLLVTGYLFEQHQLNAATLTLAWSVVFFFASAGVSAAYLTVREIFPMETRALAIALFYAVGTGLGGIIGPQLFGRLIPTGKTSDVFMALAIGAVLMIVGGVVEIVFGIDAERRAREPSPSRSPRSSPPRAAARRAPARRLGAPDVSAPPAHGSTRRAQAPPHTARARRRQEIGGARCGLKRHLEVGHHDRPDPDHVSVGDVGRDDPPSVHERAVRAAVVEQPRVVAVADQDRVAARHALLLEPHVGGQAATDVGHLRVDRHEPLRRRWQNAR